MSEVDAARVGFQLCVISLSAYQSLFLLSCSSIVRTLQIRGPIYKKILEKFLILAS